MRSHDLNFRVQRRIICILVGTFISRSGKLTEDVSMVFAVRSAPIGSGALAQRLLGHLLIARTISKCLFIGVKTCFQIIVVLKNLKVTLSNKHIVYCI